MGDGLGNVLLYRGDPWWRDPIGALIRWQTRSIYSHTALLAPDGFTIYEAVAFHGVRRRRWDAHDEQFADIFSVDGMTCWQWSNAISLAKEELGCGYDYLAIARFITRGKCASDTRWFCGEYVIDILQRAGAILLRRINSWACDPGRISTSKGLS